MPSPDWARGSGGWSSRRPWTTQGYLWSPGVKAGVQPGSPFHLTECFGPVLGVMRAADLDEAIRWQNQPAYGLTAGLHALDPAEIEHWRTRVQAGNLYVNRGTTGAIVRRQPFGGWKRSVVGPGAKAGGPNYVASLGTWPGDAALRRRPSYGAACRQAWDGCGWRWTPPGWPPRPTPFGTARCAGSCCAGADGVTTPRWPAARAAAAAVGRHVEVVEEPSIGRRLGEAGVDKLRWPGDKVRFLGAVGDATRLAALDAGWWVDDIPVAADPAGRCCAGCASRRSARPAPTRQRHRPPAGAVAADRCRCRTLRFPTRDPGQLVRERGVAAPAGRTGARPGPGTGCWWPWGGWPGPFDQDSDRDPRHGLVVDHRADGGWSCTSTSGWACGCSRAVTWNPGETPWDAAAARRPRRLACSWNGAPRTRPAGAASRRWPTWTSTTAGGATPISTCVTSSRVRGSDEPAPPAGESQDVRWFAWPEALAIADPGLAGFLQAYAGRRSGLPFSSRRPTPEEP